LSSARSASLATTWLDQIELCEVVARSLKKQHRDLYADQVLGA
jgi:hypothetical protein